MIGVRDLDQLVRTLTQRFAEQIGNTVFGDYVVHVGSRRNDSGTCWGDLMSFEFLL